MNYEVTSPSEQRIISHYTTPNAYRRLDFSLHFPVQSFNSHPTVSLSDWLWLLAIQCQLLTMPN